jgi:hypothetical protein
MDLEARIRRLEDIEEIRSLITRYGVAMDERQMDETREMFTPDARLTSKDGVFAAVGLESILETYAGRWEVLGPTYHYVHGTTIDTDPDDPGRATGVVTGHAEVVRNGQAMVVALTYNDEYRRHDGRWKFAARELGFFYYTRADQYVETMLSPNRNRAYDEPRPADYPEALKSSPA